MNLSNILAAVVLVAGGLLATGVIKSAPADVPCTANEKLLDIIKDQQKKLSDILVEDIHAANKAKQEAVEARKKYEEELEKLRNTPCKK